MHLSFRRRKNAKNFALRIDETSLEKLSYISDYNKRAINRQLLHWIQKYIRNFKQQHGEIKLSAKKIRQGFSKIPTLLFSYVIYPSLFTLIACRFDRSSFRFFDSCSSLARSMAST